MSDLVLKIDLDDLFEIITQLSPQQKRQVRERLDEDWARRLGQALDAVHDDLPRDLAADEVENDIARAIHEARTDKR